MGYAKIIWLRGLEKKHASTVTGNWRQLNRHIACSITIYDLIYYLSSVKFHQKSENKNDYIHEGL